MYSISSLMSFNPLPRAYLPPEHTSTYPRIPPPAPCSPCIQQQQQQQQQFHPQRTWSMGTLTWPHLPAYPSQLQTRKGSEPIIDVILYNNLETLRRTYLAPLLCLATLVHVLYHFHILLCHSRFPHTMPYVFSWHPGIRFLKIHKLAIKLCLSFSIFLLHLIIVRFGPCMDAMDSDWCAWTSSVCAFSLLFCFVYTTLLKLLSL